MHGKIEIHTDKDDDVNASSFVEIGAAATGDRHGSGSWKSEWICRSKAEFIEAFAKLLAALKNESPKTL